MANSLHSDLEGKVVVIKKSAMKREYQDLKYRLFRVNGGFGAVDVTCGTKISGRFLWDGEACWWDGLTLERFATQEEIDSIPPYVECPTCKGTTMVHGEKHVKDGREYTSLLPCPICKGNGGFPNGTDVEAILRELAGVSK